MEESPTKVDSGDRKPGYKSWKKKYRKMRIIFDKKMQDGEDLHKQEAKACATAKRIAVENDQLLELLYEINNSPQIPLDKRIDVSLAPPSDTTVPILPIDRQHSQQKEAALKKLEQLLGDVPHSSYAVAKENNASFINDISAPEGELFPTNFLTADDMDNYIYTIDSSLDNDVHIPTLAPAAHPGHSNTSAQPHLKNPTSVTNWLRKHAPKIFLQDGEQHHADGDDGDHSNAGSRKSRGGRGERGGRASTKGKRASAASRFAQDNGDASVDDDHDHGTPTGRGKRKRDEDPGYKPGGSRPSKKKRKSEGEGGGSRRSKKDAISASKEE